MLKTLLITAASCVVATTSFAQQAPSEALIAAISQDTAAPLATGVSYYDITANGSLEALVLYEADAGEPNWKLFATTADGYKVVAAGISGDVFIEPTEGAGGVVNADGITYALGLNGLYPHGDVLRAAAYTKVSDQDFERIKRDTLYKETARISLRKKEVDIIGDGRPETVYIIGGGYYQVGVWGTPFAIYDADGRLVMVDVTSDEPMIFIGRENPGTRVVTNMPSGQRVVELE